MRASRALISLCREVQPHHLVEKLGGFIRGETQIGGAQLGQLASGAIACQGQLWIFAGGDDQVHLGRLVFDEEGQGLIHRLRIDQMIVIKDEDEMLGMCGDFIEQGGQN